MEEIVGKQERQINYLEQWLPQNALPSQKKGKLFLTNHYLLDCGILKCRDFQLDYLTDNSFFMSIGFEYSNPPTLFKQTSMDVRVIEVLQK